MTTAPSEELLELKWAYHVMNVDHNACAHTIKQHYRTLIKEWHPDKWVGDPAREAEATKRMQAINAAYDQIEHAPLRYHIDTHPKVQQRREQRPPRQHHSAARSAERERVRQNIQQRARKRARAEFWIRFVIGAIIGALPMGWLYIALPGLDYTMFCIICAVVMLICGLGNARYKDNFWSGLGEAMSSSWWWYP